MPPTLKTLRMYLTWSSMIKVPPLCKNQLAEMPKIYSVIPQAQVYVKVLAGTYYTMISVVKKLMSPIVQLTESLVIAAAVDDDVKGADAAGLLVNIDLQVISF